MDIYTPLALPDTWQDRLADAFWQHADAFWQHRATLSIMAAALTFGAVMAAAALANL